MYGVRSCLAKGKKYAQGGVIKGPGSGTSDDIDMMAPVGSYIMPADSTAALGPDALAQMGEQVPVSVSNGEYQLPPEQVHAVGVQALDAMRDSTHMPIDSPRAPGHFFADGGMVDDEELRRRMRVGADGRPVFSDRPASPPSRAIATVPQRAPDGRAMFVDPAGRTTNVLPSQGRGMVPAGPRTSAGVPAAGPAPLSGAAAKAPAPMPAAAPPSVERVTPMTGGPRLNAGVTGPAITGSPGGVPGGFGPQQGNRTRPEPDYKARAEAKARAKVDTAGYERGQAEMDKKFTKAANDAAAEKAKPKLAERAVTKAGEIARKGADIAKSGIEKAGKLTKGAGVVGSAVSGLAEADKVGAVAADPDSDWTDVGTQTAEGAARLAGSGLGATLGSQIGAGIGAFGGPLAPLTVPAGALIGGGLGGWAGNQLTDSTIRGVRDFFGLDPSSPVDRIQPQAVERGVPGFVSQAAAATPAAPPLANNITRVGNSFSGGNIGSGYTINGEAGPADPLVYYDQNPSLAGAQNQLAKQRLFERTPDGYPGMGGGTGGGSGGGQPSAPAIAAPQPGGVPGGVARLIRSSGTPSNGEILRERMRNQAEQIAQRGQQIGADTNLRQQGLDIQRGTAEANIEAQRAQAAVAARAEQRMEALRQRYEQAQTLEERQSIALAIRDMLGQARPAYQIARTDRLINPDDPLSGKLTESFIIDPATGQARAVAGGGDMGTRVPSQNHIAALLQNKSLAPLFDETYGPGAAARYGVK